jgi:hypothetical protein
MSKVPITLFLCTGKDCRKAWRWVCDGSPGKWLKQQAAAAGLPCKLHVIKTECMDRCECAANVFVVQGSHAGLVERIHSEHDSDRLLCALRRCLETASEKASWHA